MPAKKPKTPKPKFTPAQLDGMDPSVAAALKLHQGQTLVVMMNPLFIEVQGAHPPAQHDAFVRDVLAKIPGFDRVETRNPEGTHLYLRFKTTEAMRYAYDECFSDLHSPLYGGGKIVPQDFTMTSHPDLYSPKGERKYEEWKKAHGFR